MYITHRHTSTAALLLIFVHVLTVPISLTGWVLGNYLAVFAFTGIVSLALISLSPRIPFLNSITGGTYEGWKNLKRFIGIFFIAAFIHSLTIGHPLDAFIAINWVQIFFIIGLVSYLYTELFGRFFGKYVPYKVETVDHPNNFTTEVILRAAGKPIRKHRAGQFLFVRFPRHQTLDESHPFTISSAPQEDVLRVTIKASGDFTRTLLADLKPGVNATIEGAYGLFDYKTGGKKQIWIAGGIGVTPFLSFIRDMDSTFNHDVDFYYAVRHRDEVLFYNEVVAAALKNPRLKLHIHYSATSGSLTVDEIVRNAGGMVRDHHIYMCGPYSMKVDFEKRFRSLGVPSGNIHYEEFSLR
jgi:predicted ferric reductase